MTRHDYARQLRDLGLSVFPIPYGSKVPTVSWKPLQDRLPTDDELRTWFPAGQVMNLGIVTGAISNLVVVDADSSHASTYLWARLPHTPWQTQTSRGRHFYYAHPGGHVTNRGTDVPTADGQLPIHVRGDGGYVLGHGSCHPSGHIYRSFVCTPLSSRHVPRPTLPTYDPEWLTPVPSTEHVTAPVTRPLGQATPSTDWLLFRARRYLEAIPPPVIGQGSDTQTLKVACRLVRGLGVPLPEAEELLWQWAGGRPGWTRVWIAAKVENAATYGKEPIGGLR